MKISKVTVARQAGFCFGVKRATDTLSECILTKNIENCSIFTLGNLIHNNDYNREMTKKGVHKIETEEVDSFLRDIVPNHNCLLITRAHGIPKNVMSKLQTAEKLYPHFRIFDCTCPFVSKIHHIVEENNAPENCLIIMGTPAHPEVEGICSRFGKNQFVFQTADEMAKWVKQNKLFFSAKEKVIALAQTTFKLEEWEKTKKYLKKLCTNVVFFDTICSVTESRQIEANELSKQCNAMLVIGGHDSSNTRKLFEICCHNCVDTLWIENVDDLPKDYVQTHSKVGIVAGASTPDSKIKEVVEKMDQVENFSEMLESLCTTLNTGDVVTGTVEYVTDAELQLDLGTGVTGYIKAEQVSDDTSVKLTEQFKKGDKVEAFVIRVSDVEGVAELSKKRVDKDREWKNVVAAADSDAILEGKVVAANKGGVEVSIANNRVFVPASQTGIPKDGDLNSLVGETVKLQILEVKDRKKVVGSISRVARAERRAKENEFWDNIEEGKYYTGPVKSMTDYGAFIDLGGVDGMIHMSELSWKHIKSPREVLSIGQELTVFVKSFDREKKRISLGYKNEADNPWNIFTSQYGIGDLVDVKIVKLMPFGAFAEIMDGIDGLIHISQISADRVARPQDVLQIGQIVKVKITDINNEEQKVGLSIKALLVNDDQPAETFDESVEDAQ